MNILFFLTPKSDVAFLYDDETLRQALEKMEYHKYSAVPVSYTHLDVYKRQDKEAGTPAYEILERYIGKDLEYKEYEPLFDCATAICERQHKKAFYVVCDTYVTLTDGTGVVHIAPAFGEDDSKVGKKYDLPFVQLVDRCV